ncbi:MAG: LamB/YcsF family protein [Deltaproteobacteria bacterium]|nr:MAG: LamB/YcsF family protein [Deltaproteobacteria bacterium]RLB78838.1 MAG: LamB/YcsF family protein [Deltaproteobacteria bacterium]
MKINLNADLGESFGAYQMGNDPLLLKVVKSANVACGFHAGDPWIMTQTVEMALPQEVSIGAHPAFPDLQGFGRRAMQLSPLELKASILYQVGALDGITMAMGSHVSHVKPHGALNNMACENAELAKVVAEAVRDYNREMILLAPVLSELAKAGIAAGLPVALEVFSDRAYTDSGNLVPRSQPGAVLHDSTDCVAHVQRMVEQKGIVSINGKYLPTSFHSICVHGDNIHAVETATKVRQRLEEMGCSISTLLEADL